MSNSNQDDVSSRFRSYWVGVLSLLSFGILSSFVVCMTATDPAAIDTVTAARAEVRAEKLAEVRAAQAPLVDSAAFIDEAAGTVRLPADASVELVLPQLKTRKAAATQNVVPGSPTQLKQTAAAAAEAEAAKAEETDKPKPATAPAKPAATTPKPEAKTPAPVEPSAPKVTKPKPAAEKPATAKPATEKPAAVKPAAK